MDNIYHAKEEEGVFFGAFTYITDGMFAGTYEAKCSQACLNIILQQERFTDGLAVSMDDQALVQTLDMLHIKTHFGLSKVDKMEDLFLVNWRQGQMEIFGSLVALYQVLKSEGLNLLPLSATLHPAVSAAINRPECARGYLYFLNDHWMVLRRFGNTWYKFDPWLGGPQLLTHFYVSLYILQLLTDGKLVFLIDGEFPPCPAELAEEEDLEVPIDPEPSLEDPGKPSADMTDLEIRESLRFLDLVFEGEDNELALACLLSIEDDLRKKKEEETFKQLTEKAVAASSKLNEPSDNTMAGASSEIQCIIAKRKHGTSISPVVNCNNNDNTLNIIFEVKGDGVMNLDAPEAVSSEAQHSSAESLGSNQPRGAISITSSDKSSFRKVLSGLEVADPKKEADESDTCCICWAAAPSHVVVPCGHFCLCSECVVSIRQVKQTQTQCPLCKQESSTIIKLYK